MSFLEQDFGIIIQKFGIGGNINGYICFRSIEFFGLSSLFLIYVMVPVLKKLTNKISEKKLTVFSYSLGIVFVLDMILHSIIK